MIASLTIALGLTVAGGPPYGGGGTIAPPPIPSHPVVGTTVPALSPGGQAIAHGGIPAGHGHGYGYAHGHGHDSGFILPPGPGDGWGFPNGAPDGYGWYDPGTSLPIREDRTTSYYFRRYMAVPAPSMFLPSYYNPFVTRGQRFIPYTGMGGHHAAGGAPTGSAMTQVTPYTNLTREAPSMPVPDFSGEVQSAPVNNSQMDRLIEN
ncbi:hypothetical protein [Tautonia plasticadhaerens]|uniref:Uncharacterized protein n=1 Tax=Tautonia plasticadhaerens TaxID=2527974 RepID=A0A518H2T0_9BACT|nr:hypothetical protein [Tautonia plasticadhaerens]QDV35130.1 hypothetical protein ElP_30320 [Tautonia plasticadhaerens]